MPSSERLRDRGTKNGYRRLREMGDEFRNRRIELNLSQQQVADAAGLDRADYSRAERALLRRLSVVTAARIASVLGLELWMRVFPGGVALRDAAQSSDLAKLLKSVGHPLTYRLEVGLRTTGDRTELRAWDAQISGSGKTTSLEYEAKLYDAQAQQRRWHLKLRDDPPDQFLLVIRNTPANRRVLDEFSELFAELPRLRTSQVVRALARGEHPPTGYILY